MVDLGVACGGVHGTMSEQGPDLFEGRSAAQQPRGRGMTEQIGSLRVCILDAGTLQRTVYD